MLIHLVAGGKKSMILKFFASGRQMYQHVLSKKFKILKIFASGRQMNLFFFDRSKKNSRYFSDLISRLRKSASGQLEAECFFRPLVFFSTGPGQIQAIIVNPSQTGFRPVEKTVAIFWFNFQNQKVGSEASGGRVFFSTVLFFRPVEKKQIHIWVKNDSYMSGKWLICVGKWLICVEKWLICVEKLLICLEK